MIFKETTAKNLSQDGFKQYGTVIEARGSYKELNYGFSKKWNNIIESFVFSSAEEGVNLGVLRSIPSKAIISRMERHFFTSQIFIPMVEKQYLIIVAPRTEKYPNLTQVEAFLSNSCQGVCFYPETWHCPLIPLEGEMDFVSIMNNSKIPDVEVVLFENETQIIINYGRRNKAND